MTNGCNQRQASITTMRTFIQSKAGASFYGGMPFTLAIHKDYWEYIFKLKRGYCVINAFITQNRTLLLFASWGDYFKPMQNSAVAPTILQNIKTKCPTFYKLYTEKGEFTTTTLADGTTGICKEIAFPDTATIEIMTNEEVTDSAHVVMNYSIKLYNEIYEHCPLKDWVNRLDEI